VALIINRFTPLDNNAGRWLSVGQDYFLSLMFALHLIGFNAMSGYFEDTLLKFEKAIRWIAGATFSIYLFHLPVMNFLAAISPFQKDSFATLSVLLGGTLPVCFGLAEISERRKQVWRNLFGRTVLLLAGKR
jgi:peptidoglycan/LPS O-acetylase OafA/YrhL